MKERPKKIKEILKGIEKAADSGKFKLLDGGDCIRIVEYIFRLEEKAGFHEKKVKFKDPSRKMIKCPYCKKKHQIRSHVAHERWGTEDGGYCIGDRLYLSHHDITCPSCDRTNHSLSKEFIEKNLYLFKEIDTSDKEREANRR